MKSVSMGSRWFRFMQFVLILVLVVSTSACSWFRKKDKLAMDKTKSSMSADANATIGTPERPADAPMETPRPVGLVDADQFLTRIYFDYDKAEIRSDQLAQLENNLRYLKDNADARVLIEGHCDERGTTEYNFALGDRRAQSVMSYMIDGGVAADRLQTLSKGEEEPVDTSGTEDAWAKNRRVQFKFINSGI